jgi:hypothetical protein
MYGTLFGFVESFLWEPMWPPYFPNHMQGYVGSPNVLLLGFAVAVGGAISGVIGTRAMLDRFERQHLDGGVSL